MEFVYEDPSASQDAYEFEPDAPEESDARRLHHTERNQHYSLYSPSLIQPISDPTLSSIHAETPLQHSVSQAVNPQVQNLTSGDGFSSYDLTPSIYAWSPAQQTLPTSIIRTSVSPQTALASSPESRRTRPSPRDSRNLLDDHHWPLSDVTEARLLRHFVDKLSIWVRGSIFCRC